MSSDDWGSLKPQRMMSSVKKGRTDEWYTPLAFFQYLENEFHFDLDPCAAMTGAKLCPRNFTREDDGIAQDWEGTVFMNPPYSDVSVWMRKAWEEAQKGAVVVCLIPCRTDTAWWHDYAMRGEIRLVRGRLKFNTAGSAPFPSVVIIFREGDPDAGKLSTVSNKGVPL